MKEFLQFHLIVFGLYIFANITFLRWWFCIPVPRTLSKKKEKLVDELLKKRSQKMKLRALLMNILPTIFFICGTCLYCLSKSNIHIPKFWTQTYLELLGLSYLPYFFIFFFLRTGILSYRKTYELKEPYGEPQMDKFVAIILWVANIAILLFALYIISDNLAEFPLR